MTYTLDLSFKFNNITECKKIGSSLLAICYKEQPLVSFARFSQKNLPYEQILLLLNIRTKGTF